MEGFKVRVIKKDVVKMALPKSQDEFLVPFSNMDLLMPPLEFCVFFLYRPLNSTSSQSFSSMVALLKSSLAQTLVPYYALAGDIVSNDLGEPELLCNGRGVEFFEAYADVELHGLNLHRLDESMVRFVPEKTQGVMSVQATQLKCETVVVSCLIDHRIADAYSANLLFVSWAEAARSQPISVVPSFQRSVLAPQCRLRNEAEFASIEDMYMPLSSLPPQNTKANADTEANRDHDRDGDKLLSRLYYIKAEKIKELQSLANSNGTNSTFSKLESFSAFLWRLMAKSAKKSYDAKRVTVGVIVDGRRWIDRDTMADYFGNVITGPFIGHGVNDIMENPLHWVANEVHKVSTKLRTKNTSPT